MPQRYFVATARRRHPPYCQHDYAADSEPDAFDMEVSLGRLARPRFVVGRSQPARNCLKVSVIPVAGVLLDDFGR